MKAKAVATLGVVVVVLMAAPALAQDAEPHAKGSMTFDLAAMVTSADGESPSFTALLGVGYFFADQWELSVFAMGGYTPSDDDVDSSHQVFAVARLVYYFVNSTKWVPYAGIQGGGVFTSGENAAIYGGVLGLEYLIKENLAVYLEYDIWGVDVDTGEDDEDDDISVIHQALIGLRYFF